LQVVGEGDALASLRAKAAALNLSEQVVFHGRIADEAVVRLLQQSSAFCLASVDEPFWLVCIEAMACGTPVVAVDTGGPREVVANHGCGILVPHGTPEELADALEQLLQSSSLFPTLSAGATARAADFDWGGCVDQLERILFQAAVASAR